MWEEANEVKVDSPVVGKSKDESEETVIVNKVETKCWTTAIWGNKVVAATEVTQKSDNLDHDLVDDKNREEVERKGEDEETPLPSESSTPSTGSRSISPESDLKSCQSKSSTETVTPSSRKSTRIRQIRKASDSEDSSVSTDSPLKPRSLCDAPNSITQSSTPSKAARIPKKKKSLEKDDKDEGQSPGEEMPLIPKGFLEQKKKMEEEEKKCEEEPVRIMTAEEKKEIEAKLKMFRRINENNYLCARKVNKQSKKMQCDCTLTKEEIAAGEKGCGDDCLNRLLFIECGKVCQLDTLCSNKRFQNIENAPIEVFKTDWKGFGLRATEPLPRDTFLMEYVGEVLDTKQFRKRARQYAREEVQHFYFMALSKEFYVDATSKGNISR